MIGVWIMLYSERGKPIPPISPPPPKPHTHTQTHDSAVVVPALFCLWYLRVVLLLQPVRPWGRAVCRAEGTPSVFCVCGSSENHQFLLGPCTCLVWLWRAVDWFNRWCASVWLGALDRVQAWVNEVCGHYEFTWYGSAGLLWREESWDWEQAWWLKCLFPQMTVARVAPPCQSRMLLWSSFAPLST